MTRMRQAADYRPDIDGLRAIAVLLVVCFHFFPETIKAGYIGVDIFFVISGYLITSQLTKELSNQKFSVIHFYSRRVRRLFPALLIVLVTGLVVGWLYFVPAEYAMLGKHTFASAGFFNNISLLGEKGYFDYESIRKPLLHLWSLGVEGQFYLVWPLVLWAAYRFRLSFFWVAYSLGLLSFLINILPSLLTYFGALAANVFPRMDADARFYLPHFRFWELLAGAALAQLSEMTKNIERIRTTFAGVCSVRRIQFLFTANALSIYGLLVLLIGLVVIRKGHLFFGTWALFPTLAAFCLIAAGREALVNRILSRRIFVGLGLISYPLYLWHWPILSFLQTLLGTSPNVTAKIFCIFVSLLLAFLTYRFVERPVRSKKYLSTLLLMMIAVGGFGYFIWADDGLRFRSFAIRTDRLSHAATDWSYPGSLTSITVPNIKSVAGRSMYTNSPNPPDILFVGDSHINQYLPRIELMALRHSLSFVMLSGDGCAVIPNVYGGEDPHCVGMLEDMKALLASYPSIKKVVITNYWHGYFATFESFVYREDGIGIPLKSPKGEQLALESFAEWISALNKTHKVYVLLDNPSSRAFDPLTMIGNRLEFTRVENLDQWVVMPADSMTWNHKIRSLAHKAGVRVIDPTPVLCHQDRCARIDSETGAPIYKDADHLTSNFVLRHATYIDQIFR